MDLSQYQLEALHRNEEFVLYKGVRGSLADDLKLKAPGEQKEIFHVGDRGNDLANYRPADGLDLSVSAIPAEI